jgi:hypothetical protein
MYKYINWNFCKTENISINEVLEILNKEEISDDFIKIWKDKICPTNLKATPNDIDIWEKDWEYYFAW